LYVQNITTALKEVKRKALSETFNLVTDQTGDFLAQSLGKGGVLRLQADAPAKNTGKAGCINWCEAKLCGILGT